MKKFIGVLVAALIIVQSSFAAFAATVTVDGDVKVSTGSDYTSNSVSGTTNDTYNYLATIDMSNVRSAFQSYCAVAEAQGVDLDTAVLSGAFAVIITGIPDEMIIPEAFLEEGNMVGFSDNASIIFGEDGRVVEDDILTISIVIKDGVTASAVLADIDNALGDFTLTCEGVKFTDKGTFPVVGDLTGAVTTTAAALTVEFGLDEALYATADVTTFYTVSVTADSNVSGVTLVDVAGNEYEMTTSEDGTYTATVPEGIYTVDVETADGTEVDITSSSTGLDASGNVALSVSSETSASIVTVEESGNTIVVEESTIPTDVTYTEGTGNIDLSGLTLTVTDSAGNTTVVSYDDNKDDFTVEESVDDSTKLHIIYDNQVVATITVSETTLTTVSATITAPVRKAQVSTKATAPLAANYTLSAIEWSPEVDTSYAASTTYTATVVATANDGCVFSADTAAYVNGNDATSVEVSADGKTVTFTYTFPKTSNGSSNGTSSGGTSSFSTGSTTATATPAADATATPDETGWVNPFTDVASDDWFYEAVRYVYQAGLMNGTSDTTFEPNADITRGMFITIIHRLEGTPAATTTNNFTDVDSSQYYAEAVAWGYENGIVTGYSDTEYAPDEPILREQMAALMARYADFKGVDTTSATAGYADADQISEYAVPYVNFVTSLGLMTGVGNNSFDPQADTTRAEVATVMMRVMNNYAAIFTSSSVDATVETEADTTAEEIATEETTEADDTTVEETTEETTDAE